MSTQILIIGGLVVAIGVIATVLWLKRGKGSKNMALLTDIKENRQRSRVGGVVFTFLENLEFVRAMETLIRRHKHEEAARVALLIGDHQKAAELFLRGKAYGEAAELFMQLGDLPKAASAFQANGELVKAADLYLKIGKPVMAAQLLLESGDQERAMAILEQQASEYERLLVMAMVWSKKGDYDTAGQNYFQAGHYEEAAQAFEQAGDYSRAAQAYLKAGKEAMAARAMETAGRRKDAIRIYEKAGLMGEAARVASSKPVTDSEVIRLANKGNLFAAGLKAYQQKEFALAERLLRAMKPGDKGYEQRALFLGRICKSDGRLGEAQDYFKAYLQGVSLDESVVSSVKMALKFLEERDELDICLSTLKRMQKAKLLDKELKEMLHKLELRHVQHLLGDAIPLENWVQEGTQHQVVGIEMGIVAEYFKGKYKVLDKLKETGAVSAIKAVSEAEGKDVAIRVLHAWKLVVKPELKQIIHDIKGTAKLKHPNLVPVIDTGFLENNPYVVIELPSAETLSNLLRSEKPIPVNHMISIIDGMTKALDFLHGHGFVHKSFSPACVFVFENGTSVLSGLGIPDLRFVRQGRIVWGDPVFISPEVKIGRTATKASDIYGFALLIINLLLGDLPYSPKEGAVDTGRVLADLRKKYKDFSLGVWAMLQMATSNTPYERPKTASSIAKEVINALKKHQSLG